MLVLLLFYLLPSALPTLLLQESELTAASERERKWEWADLAKERSREQSME